MVHMLETCMSPSSLLLGRLGEVLALLRGLCLNLSGICRVLQMCCGWVCSQAIRTRHIVELIVPPGVKVIVEVRVEGTDRLLISVIHELVHFTRWSCLKVRLVSHL